MIIIAHRGNIDGINKNTENDPFYIDRAINKGYFVEIDLWFVDNQLYLGHNNPQYPIDIDWIIERKQNLIIHEKNIDCCLCKDLLLTNRVTHNIDDYAITSTHIGWTTKKELLNENTIWVINEKKEDLTGLKLLGICTDYANYYNTLSK